MTQERILPTAQKYRTCPSPQEAVEDIKACLESMIHDRERYLKTRIKDCTSIEFARHTERISTLKDIYKKLILRIYKMNLQELNLKGLSNA